MFPTSKSNNHFQGDVSMIPPASSSRLIRFKHIIVALILSIIFFILFCFISLHAFIAWVLSNPTVAPVYSNPMLAKGMAYEDVTFPAIDGSRNVSGWYIPAENESKKTIVFSHGYGANREESWIPMYDLAHYAHQQNFNVIMFDYGFASQNSRDVATGGKAESKQLLGAVQLAKEKGAEEVVVWGFSMGAGTALQAALVSTDIDAMILDSTFLLEPDTLYHNIQNQIDLPKQPTLQILTMLFPILNGTSLNSIPYQEVKSKDYDIPILFIHGTQDDKAPYPMAELLASNQTNPNSDVWIVDNAKHELIFREHPKEYLRKISTFLGNIQLTEDIS